jgi:adenylate kinase family enzyme
MTMAISPLILALRMTALRLDSGAPFRWTHMGACICGNLAQTVTHLSAADIHRAALQKAGDWGEQAYDYCPASGLPMDHIMGTLLQLGLGPADIRHLERLSDPYVLRRLPVEQQMLNRLERSDVILYLTTWADLLQERAGHRSLQAVA